MNEWMYCLSLNVVILVRTVQFIEITADGSDIIFNIMILTRKRQYKPLNINIIM